jgi:hypothetical protein
MKNLDVARNKYITKFGVFTIKNCSVLLSCLWERKFRSLEVRRINMIWSSIRCIYYAAWLARRQQSAKFLTWKLIKTDCSVEIVTRFCCDWPNLNRCRNHDFYNTEFESFIMVRVFIDHSLIWRKIVTVESRNCDLLQQSFNFLFAHSFYHTFVRSFVLRSFSLYWIGNVNLTLSLCLIRPQDMKLVGGCLYSSVLHTYELSALCFLYFTPDEIARSPHYPKGWVG